MTEDGLGRISKNKWTNGMHKRVDTELQFGRKKQITMKGQALAYNWKLICILFVLEEVISFYTQWTSSVPNKFSNDIIMENVQ